LENNLQIFKSDRFDVDNTASLSLFFYPQYLLALAKNHEGLITALFQYQDVDWEKSEVHLHLLLAQLPAVPAHVFFHNPIFTLVPNTVLVPENENNYLAHLVEFSKDPIFFSTPIDLGDFGIASFLPGKIKQILEDKFPALHFSHGSCSFLSYVLHEKSNQLSQEIIVNCFDSFIYLAGFFNRELVVFNRFEIHSLEEILKYILITQETLKFEKNSVRVTLFGNFTNYELTESIGNQFFTNFRLTRPYTNQRYSPVFTEEYPRRIFESFWELR
jgi:hypothetical protein